DVQIKGYPVRLSLDVVLAFTANPEDYTARGKIITPLKDRIGAEIQTHYPPTVEYGMAITAQEAWTDRNGKRVQVPDFVREVVERIAFEARFDKRIDHRSGVSQRLPISVLETVLSNAERRAVTHREKAIVPRVSDIYAALPSVTGKIELEYEGELQGAQAIAVDLIRRACRGTFEARAGGADVDGLVMWFDGGAALKVADQERTDLLLEAFSSVPGLLDLVRHTGLAPTKDAGAMVAACELVLEGLVAQKRISRNDELGYVMARRERGPGAGGTGLGGPNLFA
ncbi:MAG: magnesium chelatase, partial [Gemmatimonadales bacterium]